MPQDGFVPWQTAPRNSLGTNPASIYSEVRQVGKGTYGDVFLGSNNATKETVALKKVSWQRVEEKHKRRGFPLNALREIRLLKNKCSHPNLVKLLDVAAHVPSNFESKSNEWEEEEEEKSGFVYLVFEYVDHDLAGIIDAFRANGRSFSVSTVKCLIKQLLEALVYIHSQNICHRDLKCSNMLIGRDYHLKLADFGLARELNNEGLLSPRVVTLWYRAPELLLGDTRYTIAVDIWSVGCILIELLRMSPVFPGKEELDQLRRIFMVCGFPDSNNWPSFSELPHAKQLSKLDSVPRSTSVPYAEAEGVEQFCAMKQLDSDAGHLADRLLALDPARRCSAIQALQFKFLLDAPPPRSLPPFDTDVSYHEWETKNIRKQQTAAAKGKESSEIPSQATSGSAKDAKLMGDDGKEPRLVEERKDLKLAGDLYDAKPVDDGSSGRKERDMMIDQDRRARKNDPAGEIDDRHARKDRKRGSSPGRKRDRGMTSDSVDSRDRARHASRRSLSPRRRERNKERKSKKHSRRSRSPSRRRRG